jgi:hypothetical protein
MTTQTIRREAAVDEADLIERLGRLTIEQKVRLLTGADFWALHDEPAIGLRRLVASDGPAGVRGESWDERDPSANVPSPTALAATWDEARIERIGLLLASGPGETARVEITLAGRALQHWDTNLGWTVEAGVFHLGIGRSVADLQLTAEITVAADS